MSGMGDMGNLLKQAQEMQRQVDRVRSELREKVVEGRAAGGAVRIEVTADRHEVRGVHLNLPGTPSSDEIADHVRAALSDALRRAEEAEREEIKKVTGGLHLPGLF